ncbi:hypothetical protein [Mycobacteroides abscessus]|uniref:hypothetical protein n=1 Tax=Mycobacteroides abscessus TaxID=36809 RepID=UPI0009A87587|nr:hypothetical protein [Mycobacteroides abscessus]SKT21324.1 Uncharacterised protein [Mycobacteroides abscessus subsp. bolletii]SLF57179.1 Uncharacterised protein [Mycobacteroides abscessus subsp. bolletii]
MSLVFTKKSLITAAEKAIKNRQHEILAWQKRVDNVRAEHARTWNEKGRDRIVALRNAITRELKSSGPVTIGAIRKDLPNIHSLSDLFYCGPSDYELKEKVGRRPDESDVEKYRGLIDLMKAHTGDTISANQLKLLGYTKLTELFNAAVREGGTS